MSCQTSLADLANMVVNGFHASPLDWMILSLLVALGFVSLLLRVFRLACEEYADFERWWMEFQNRRTKGS